MAKKQTVAGVEDSNVPGIREEAEGSINEAMFVAWHGDVPDVDVPTLISVMI